MEINEDMALLVVKKQLTHYRKSLKRNAKIINMLESP